jgi:hypothetical protein
LILKEILYRSVAKAKKWTTLVHFSDDFMSFDISRRATLLLGDVSNPYHSGFARQDRLIETPISRPKSRHKFSHRWIAVTMNMPSSLQSSEILFVAWDGLPAGRYRIRFLRTGCEPNRTRHPSSMP